MRTKPRAVVDTIPTGMAQIPEEGQGLPATVTPDPQERQVQRTFELDNDNRGHI